MLLPYLDEQSPMATRQADEAMSDHLDKEPTRRLMVSSATCTFHTERPSHPALVESPAPVAKLKITKPLRHFPAEIYTHAESLEHLDLSGTGLSVLPEDFGRLRKLKVAFFSDCNFSVFPRQLASCPDLEMVAFRGNGMREVPEASLPPRLRWLILTNNLIGALPRSIRTCVRLQKCMLSGNQLCDLPEEMASCRKLGLRLAANRIEQLPGWLFGLPELAFLSFAGNPCASSASASECDGSSSGLVNVSFDDLRVQEVHGEGASGVISKAVWHRGGHAQQVAIKLFKGTVTSDGAPMDEMRACIRAGSHANLIDPLGEICDHSNKGLVMQLIPAHYTTLGLPPSLESCTRDCFSQTSRLTTAQGLRILQSVASAAEHLHQRRVAHGDMYAHNILFDEQEHALLGDFGAASMYGDGHKMEQLEVLAFAHLMEDVWRLIKANFDEGEMRIAMLLAALHRRCSLPVGSERPTFAELSRSLSEMK
ncbi:Uu.00g104430.m01.CDS01 [Anthostomella pinea]|uniref:Uu.00g104430.m01.CDS01 n=1 Tax=Anthostomella pinea TaxID=933095 RepID=A0AAI8VE89_9PEZI|nr:Uu.00g104430.m01.CDS01 [Anthostomella pinea]